MLGARKTTFTPKRKSLCKGRARLHNYNFPYKVLGPTKAEVILFTYFSLLKGMV